MASQETEQKKRGRGRPRESESGQGNPMLRLRVREEVAAWVKAQGQNWLHDLIEREYANANTTCQHQFWITQNGRRTCEDCGAFCGYAPGREPGAGVHSGTE